MRILFVICLFFFFSNVIYPSSIKYKYWIGFKDKENNSYSLDHPEEFFSSRALERRKKQDIPFQINDLPVSNHYIDSIRNSGFDVLYSLKWFNGIVVETNDSTVDYLKSRFEFIKEIKHIYTSVKEKSGYNKFKLEDDYSFSDTVDLSYGKSVWQIETINGDYLHEKGYFGNGKLIAVLDGGFYSVDSLPAFESIRTNNKIIGTKNFVDSISDIYDTHHHGTHVLSIMGGYHPGILIGTAPDANYFLIRTEDVWSEYPVEEYNWVAGAELADSIGADIINSSLGYFKFDDPRYDYSYSDMDGNTTIVTKAADIAASKGIFVVSSAGNEGQKDWRYIIAPTDGDSVMSAGAINYKGKKAGFSSFGPRSDGAIKPNVMAMGSNTIIQNFNGYYTTGNGTSYSAPIISGMAACLWEAFPEKTNMEIFRAIELSADMYYNPDSLMGNGIPDFEKAAQILEQVNKNDSLNPDKAVSYSLFPNPFKEEINIYLFSKETLENVSIQVSTSRGEIVYSDNYDVSRSSFIYLPVNKFSIKEKGIYILQISTAYFNYSRKIVRL